MTARWDAVTVGEVYLGHVFSGLTSWPSPGEEIYTQHYTRELAGGAANTACGLGRLGRRTAIVGVIGAGEADWITRRLAAFEVNSYNLRTAALGTGATVTLAAGDNRSLLIYPGANSFLMELLESVQVFEELQSARHVHFAVSLPRNVTQRLLPGLKAAGVSVSMEVGWQPGFREPGGILESWREADFLFAQEREARLLVGAEEPEGTMRRLSRMGLANTILNLGSRGARALDQGRVLFAASPSVNAADATGAADAFNAGLIDAILDGQRKQAMLARAAACRELSTRGGGGLEGLPTRKELKGLEGKHPSDGA